MVLNQACKIPQGINFECLRKWYLNIQFDPVLICCVCEIIYLSNHTKFVSKDCVDMFQTSAKLFLLSD